MKAALLLTAFCSTFSPELLFAESTGTVRHYLSGTGLHDEMEWDFRCTEGRNCGEWTTIPVPSNWELQGFGAYNYGLDEERADEQGQYRHRFQVPSEWRKWQNRRVKLVFEGSMTDTAVWVNGKAAGPKHQGSFYRFDFDVTELLKFDGENILEVHVDKQSSDTSVNAAEREADYWIFGGIYRPVYLESSPHESIAEVRIDARHNGKIELFIEIDGLQSPGLLEVQVKDSNGLPLGLRLSQEVESEQLRVRLSANIPHARPWSAETPTLYSLEVRLTRDKSVIHRRDIQFGFRTIEVRPGEGLFVNQRRVLLKGVNRHSFWPSSGRTLNRRLNRADAELLKSLNMNAVRTAHYPPDVEFLEACDELGLYVIDELAGWHDAYDTVIGRRLVQKMVSRDHNHPSVIFWSNGNEGGWNTKLDSLFVELDLQDRAVLHPGEVFSAIDTNHYPTFAELKSLLDPRTLGNQLLHLIGKRRLVMPTEFLHGLYDGGSGAGLEDYWRLLRSSPHGAGGFLWALFDESVVRSDRLGELDSDGNHAPDGIVGPYRERGPNFTAVRAAFSPITLRSSHPEGLFEGSLEIENRFSRTDLSQYKLHWKLLTLAHPEESVDPTQVLAHGVEPGPFLRPGDSGTWSPRLDVDLTSADLLRVQAIGPSGREVMSWSFPTQKQHQLARSVVIRGDSGSIDLNSVENRIVVTTGERQAVFDANTGLLIKMSLADTPYPIDRGPRLLAETSTLPSITIHRSETQVDIAANPSGEGSGAGEMSWRWSIFPSGWVRLKYRYSQTRAADYFGIGFDLDPRGIRGIRWFGLGPHPIWKNRRQGAALDLWSASLPYLPKGILGSVRWLLLASAQLDLIMVVETPGIDIGLFQRQHLEDLLDASGVDAGGLENASPNVADADLTFLHAIPAIGTKFHRAAELGPQSLPTEGLGLYRGSIWLRLSAVPE
ncbi:MAG: glycoside hydrolase family 2 TIM barrel-domain containing protein [Thermoanaerobaculia bacterium]